MAKRIYSTESRQSPPSATRKERMIVYQLFPRIFTNSNPAPSRFGSLEENGSGKLNDITPKVLESLRHLGINTLWLTGVIEHATKTDFSQFGIEKDHPAVVKGEAGSPYAIKDYYDVDPAIADDVPNRIKELQAAIDRIHSAGMKVIIDFVPNHTARNYHSDKAPEGVEDFGKNDDITKFFSPNNNYYYIPNQSFSPSIDLESPEGSYMEFPAKATGNDCFSAFCSEFDWYETAKLNYGHDYGNHSDHFNPVPDTWKKMLHILEYWVSLGVDGFRCDMVFMVPLPFWHWVIPKMKKEWPNVFFIGEIYDVAQYRPFIEYGCFDYLYDKVNLYDTLVGIEKYNVSAAKLTDCWKTVDGLGNKMLNFLENHDEVRFASSEFAGNPERVVPYLIVSSMISKGPFMIYYGQELGERGEDNEGFAGLNHRTSIFDYWSLDTLRRWYAHGNCSDSGLLPNEKWLRDFYGKVLRMCNNQSSIREGEFFDLMYVNLQNPDFDPHSLFSWLRYDDDEALLIVCNFSREDKELKINIPVLAFEMAQLQEGPINCNDLLWKTEVRTKLRQDCAMELSVKSSSALIIPLRGKIKKENI